jgi:hypothetical protein
MTQRTNTSVTTTDVLIAMLSSDLRGWSGAEGPAVRVREHVDPSASAPLPVMTETEDPEEPAR